MNPRIDPEQYRLPDHLTDAEVVERLKCPLTRLCNIYKIKDPDGKVIPFWPNEPQCEVLYAVFIEKCQRIAIPKARAIGFSTLIVLILFDRAHFAPDSDNVAGAIIDQTQPDAQAKLAKIKFAYEKMPDVLRDAVVQDNKGTLEWANGSSITAGLNARGRTPQLVHISEWGPIAYDDPARSQEIVTGALQAASGKSALVFAESTHKGGKGGDWYQLIKRSLETPPEHRTEKDFRVMFFPWWQEKRYTLEGDARQIDTETSLYLNRKVMETGHVFTPGQRLFYFKKKKELGRQIYAEFPTVLEECWMAPFTGAIYAPDVDKSRQAGRIADTVGHYEGFPVYTAFDIGAPANTWCWFFQVIGDRINLLEALVGGDDCNTPSEWATRIKAKAYNYGGHFLPHDGETLWRRLLNEAGLKGVVVMSRIVNEWDNVNDALSAFNRCHFHKTNCERGIDSLEAYRAKEEADGVTIRNVPVHDWASHASTAFGYIHQAIRLGLLVDRSAMPTKPGGGVVKVHTGISSMKGQSRSFRVKR
jgi:hypothetical protein